MYTYNIRDKHYVGIWTGKFTSIQFSVALKPIYKMRKVYLTSYYCKLSYFDNSVKISRRQFVTAVFVHEKRASN